MLVMMLSTPSFALTCDPVDQVCNTANAVRDLVNSVRPNSIGDARSGKRSTQFVEARLGEIFEAAGSAGCIGLGIGAVESNNGLFSGVYQDIDFTTGDVLGGGTYDGIFSNNELFGEVDSQPDTLGDWGRYHFPSGKLAALRGSPDTVVVGGLARINGRRAVAWAVHGFCPVDVDVASAVAPYMPQVERYAVETEPPPVAGECGPNSPVVESFSISEDGSPNLITNLFISDVDGDLGPDIGFTLSFDGTPNGVIDGSIGTLPLLLNTPAQPCSLPSVDVVGLPLPFALIDDVINQLGGPAFPYGQLADLQVEIADNDTILGALPPQVGSSQVITVCIPFPDGSPGNCPPPPQ